MVDKEKYITVIIVVPPYKCVVDFILVVVSGVLKSCELKCI